MHACIFLIIFTENLNLYLFVFGHCVNHVFGHNSKSQSHTFAVYEYICAVCYFILNFKLEFFIIFFSFFNFIYCIFIIFILRFNLVLFYHIFIIK